MDFEQILEAIEKLSVLELNELVKAAEEKFGVSASAPVVVGAVAGGEAAAAVEEKSEFDVILASVGAEKMKVVNAPKAVKEGVSKEEAEQMKAKLEEVGATVELK